VRRFDPIAAVLLLAAVIICGPILIVSFLIGAGIAALVTLGISAVVEGVDSLAVGSAAVSPSAWNRADGADSSAAGCVLEARSAATVAAGLLRPVTGLHLAIKYGGTGRALIAPGRAGVDLGGARPEAGG